MRRFNQSLNGNKEVNTESGLSVIQFWIDRAVKSTVMPSNGRH